MNKPVIGIIGGKGRMGKLFADFFKEHGLKVLISDLGTKLTNEELAKEADITIVSVPIDHTEKTIHEVLPYIPRESALMDFTSVKSPAIKSMLSGKCEVLGIHPMFGNSNPIPGQTVILCPTRKSGKWSKWMEDFLRQNEVNILKMSAKDHDKRMGLAQALIHFAEITFADALRRSRMPVRELLSYTGKASELKVQLAARILDQDAGLYGNIQLENPLAAKLFKNYQKSVDELIKINKKKDLKAFKNYFEKNRKFMGKYAQEAYLDSSYLIEKLIEKKQKKATPEVKKTAPGKNDIAVLGPKNTHSDVGASKYLENKQKHKKYFTKDIEEIFSLVESGKVALGLAPIENKLHGTVRETLDALFSFKVQIIDEINIPIHHCLVTLSGTKKAEIKKIISHSQALGQCKKHLKQHFPKAELQSVTSTAQAISHLLDSQDKTAAAIAPEIACDNPKIKILAKNIEDSGENSTTFIVVQKGLATLPTGTAKNSTPTKNSPAKTSVAFYFKADSPGSLFTVFKDFADAKINMTKIESRPTKAHFGDYIFYLDFEGHIKDPRISKTLKTVQQKVAELKILGSYYLAQNSENS